MKYTCQLGSTLKRLGVTQSTLASSVQTDSYTISRLCTGTRLPALRLAAKIAAVLNCAIEDLWPNAAKEAFDASAARQAERAEPKPASGKTASE